MNNPMTEPVVHLSVSADHLAHLKYVRDKVLEFMNDSEKSLFSSLRTIEFIEGEIKLMEEELAK